MNLNDKRFNKGKGVLDRLEPPMAAGKIPPHDLEAEAAVLSTVLLDSARLGQLTFLVPRTFYSDPNGIIWGAALALAAENKPIDLVTVTSYLRERGHLDAVGGMAYIAQLADATPAVANVEAHAMTVWECWRLRKVIAVCQVVAAQGYGDVGNRQEFVDAALESLSELSRAPGVKPLTTLRAALTESITRLTKAAQNGDRITGISTGYDRLDAKTAGLHDGDLTVVAARPGMGKTSYVLNLAINVATPRHIKAADNGPPIPRMGDPVIVFSCEMPTPQIADRIVCSEGRVDLGKLRQGFLQPDDWRRLTEAASFLAQLPIWIDDTAAISLLQMRSKIREANNELALAWRRQNAARGIVPGPDDEPPRVRLVILDYIQLATGDKSTGSREQEVSSISRGLKQLGKDLRCSVIALSQLNRSVETRGKDKRPQLSDLRESGAIEQDADTIQFIYRDEYYNPETTNAKGIAEINIAKQRNGPTGRLLLRFASSCTRFDNLAPGDYPELTEDD
jgi:replicative DNA helicase